MTARCAGAAVLVTVVLAMVGCDTNECPAGWDPDVPDSAVSTGCGPPAGYEEAVRERIGTGLFGHATYRRGENVGPGYSCEYESEELAGQGVFEIAPYDELEGLGPSTFVEVRRDGTWEVALLPGVEYRPLWRRGDASVGVDRREVETTGNSVVLRQGQVVLAHILLSEC